MLTPSYEYTYGLMLLSHLLCRLHQMHTCIPQQCLHHHVCQHLLQLSQYVIQKSQSYFPPLTPLTTLHTQPLCHRMQHVHHISAWALLTAVVNTDISLCLGISTPSISVFDIVLTPCICWNEKIICCQQSKTSLLHPPPPCHWLSIPYHLPHQAFFHLGPSPALNGLQQVPQQYQLSTLDMNVMPLQQSLRECVTCPTLCKLQSYCH